LLRWISDQSASGVPHKSSSGDFLAVVFSHHFLTPWVVDFAAENPYLRSNPTPYSQKFDVPSRQTL
jgi:hypothetical protein